jgi:hypothetical protein
VPFTATRLLTQGKTTGALLEYLLRIVDCEYRQNAKWGSSDLHGRASETYVQVCDVGEALLSSLRPVASERMMMTVSTEESSVYTNLVGICVMVGWFLESRDGSSGGVRKPKNRFQSLASTTTMVHSCLFRVIRQTHQGFGSPFESNKVMRR